jgi:hypothetical protein
MFVPGLARLLPRSSIPRYPKFEEKDIWNSHSVRYPQTIRTGVCCGHSTRIVDLEYHPVIAVSRVTKVVEGTRVKYIECLIGEFNERAIHSYFVLGRRTEACIRFGRMLAGGEDALISHVFADLI